MAASSALINTVMASNSIRPLSYDRSIAFTNDEEEVGHRTSGTETSPMDCGGSVEGADGSVEGVDDSLEGVSGNLDIRLVRIRTLHQLKKACEDAALDIKHYLQEPDSERAAWLAGGRVDVLEECLVRYGKDVADGEARLVETKPTRNVTADAVLLVENAMKHLSLIHI